MSPKAEAATSRVTLHEWERLGPDTDERLKDRVIDGRVALATATFLNQRKMLKVTELRSGVGLRSTSYVGHVRMGSLDVTIRPKIGWDGLLRLARYAYGLRPVDVGPRLDVALDQDSLVDLLVLQLCAEARAIAARGRHRNYRVERRVLGVPRGRLDVPRLAMQEVSAAPGLPCVVRPRSEDVVLNRLVLGGLRLGSQIAELASVRGEAARTAAMWADGVVDTRLNGPSVRQATRELNRITENYRAALQLVDAILEGTGASLREEPLRVPLPVFMLDMNRFFQHLLSRFLHEFLDGFTIRDEHMLRRMLSYDPAANPQRRRAPTPRPDFAVQTNGQTVALLDAKYRDLWERALPREMLYQLTAYALSQPPGFEAAILYPSMNEQARLQRIAIKDPIRPIVRAMVALRPVPLARLEQLLAGQLTAEHRRDCRDLARQIALGAN
jgi:5-methylcytosine-specific restriction enzyme subunit McrC